MVTEGTGRLFKRKDGKWLIYLPKDLCEDSQFPFRDLGTSIKVKVSFNTANLPRDKKLLVEEASGLE